MYKILNYIFGWDYIAWTNFAASGVARIHRCHSGQVFYWRYKNINVIDRVTRPETVIWLTCSPDKYFTESQ